MHEPSDWFLRTILRHRREDRTLHEAPGMRFHILQKQDLNFTHHTHVWKLCTSSSNVREEEIMSGALCECCCKANCWGKKKEVCWDMEKHLGACDFFKVGRAVLYPTALACRVFLISFSFHSLQCLTQCLVTWNVFKGIVKGMTRLSDVLRTVFLGSDTVFPRLQLSLKKDLHLFCF